MRSQGSRQNRTLFNLGKCEKKEILTLPISSSLLLSSRSIASHTTAGKMMKNT